MKKYLKGTCILLALIMLTSLPALAAPQRSPGGNGSDEGAVYYTIIRHDTLWDISERFLKDPFKWSYLWKLNPYIKNPDLIYPGDVVKIVPISVEEGRHEAGGFDTSSLPVVDLSGAEPKVVVLRPEAPKPGHEKPKGPSYGGANMRREGFISKHGLENAGVIMRAKDERLLIAHGDEVFLSFRDRAAVQRGARYTVFRKGPLVRHPVTGKKIGNMIEILGSLVVTSDAGVPEGKIEESYEEIEAGSMLMPYRETPREVRIRPSAAPVDGYIIASLTGNENLSRGDILYIDRGTDDGLEQGRLLKVIRRMGTARDPITGKKVQLPPEEIGAVVVVDPGKHTSSCIVIKSVKTILAGDLVRAGAGL